MTRADVSVEIEAAALEAVTDHRPRRGAHARPPGSPCANCAIPLKGPWCYACGQLGDDYHRSAWHLAIEAFEGLFHFDGRFWRTIPDLVLHPARLTRAQMNRWSRQFDSWDVCDQVCGNLFDRNRLSHDLAIEWTRRKPEFARRAGYVLMASLAVHAKDLPDSVFERYLEVIRGGATDPRNFVRKAVNWALRQIGKRNPRLRRLAIAEARRIARIDSPAARWIASDALRELTA